MTGEAVAAERRRVLGLLALLLLLSLPALADPGAVARGAARLDLAAGPHPWLTSSALVLLRIWIPVVTLSSLVLTLAPGLLLALGFGLAESAAQWLLFGLTLSVLTLSPVTELLELVAGGPLRGRTFALLAMATTTAAALVPWRQAASRRMARLARDDWHVVAAAAAGSLALLLAMEPKFLWEVFNGDGGHTYESTRLVLHQALPFWPAEAGPMSSYPGITSFVMSYPASWFVRLFGEIEASVRIPYLLFTAAGLFPGLLLLIDAGRSKARSASVPWLLWAGLFVYSVVLCFSATYNPYHADIALPATQDVLVIAWFLGFAWAFTVRRTGWMIAFAGLTFGTSPAGLILLGLWLVSAVVMERPVPLRPVALGLAIVAGWFVVSKLAGPALLALGQPAPGSEHGTGTLARRLLSVRLFELHRGYFFVVPAGILPALAVPLVWRQDGLARTMAATAAAQFAFFYFQGRVSLHYFAPAMVLPLVVYWRTVPALLPSRAALAGATLAAALVALFVSWPQHPGPHLDARAVGAGIDDRLGGYNEGEAGAMRRARLLTKLIPVDAHHTVPDSSYGGSPLAWFYYAHHAQRGGIGYVFAPLAAPPDHGALVDTVPGIGLYVTDSTVLARDRARRPVINIARLYQVDKFTLFIGR